MHLAERPPETLRRLRGQDQMDVVRHQAIGPHRDPLAPAGLLQKIAIERVVAVAEKKQGFAPDVLVTDKLRSERRGQGGNVIVDSP